MTTDIFGQQQEQPESSVRPLSLVTALTSHLIQTGDKITQISFFSKLLELHAAKRHHV